MGAQHTPGPWLADLHNTAQSGGRTYGWVRGGNQIVPLAGVTLGVEGMAQDEGRANARLIAAAPELLAAAETLLQSAFAEHYRLISPFKELAAAIAKARGSAQ